MLPFPLLTGKEQLSYLESILRDLNDSDENDGDDDMGDTGTHDDDSTPEVTGSPDDDLYPGGTSSADADSENTITGYEQDENDAPKRGYVKSSYEEDDDEENEEDEEDEEDESSEGAYQENDE